MSLSRRSFLTTIALGAAGAGTTTLLGRAPARGDGLLDALSGASSKLPASAAPGADLGTLLDYAAGVPSVDAIKAGGFAGAIRYVSDRRPGGEYLIGKPLLAAEATALRAAGLAVVSCYQFGKGTTADWLGGYPAGVKHARRAAELHTAAGGPPGAPIYASIDDDPSLTQFVTQIAPFLLGWHSVIGRARTGMYGNAPTLQWASATGLASWFWQHNWGTPAGYLHPAANLHQVAIDKDRVGGVGVDRNTIITPQYGQWV